MSTTNNPTRREFLQGTLAAAGTALVPSLAKAADGAPAQKRPNIVFFFGEGQRADELSIAGNQILMTPNYDRIASEGLRFTNAFCTNALCGPARTSTLTSLYSRSNGVLGNGGFRKPLAQDIPLFTEILRDAGYEVAIVGKVHVPNGVEERHWDYYFGHNNAGNNYWNPIYKEGWNGTVGPEKQYENIYADNLAVDRALNWLEQRKSDKPFCLLVWFVTPHAPFYRDRKYLDLYRTTVIPKPDTFDDDYKGYPGKPRAFANAGNKIGTTVMGDAVRSLEELVKDHYAGLKSTDDLVGKVFGYLEQKQILDDTAILHGSDHGFFLGEWRCYDKRFMHEPSIRVPLMIRYPKRIPAGTVRTEMALDLDIAPTLLDLAGVEIPAHFQGKSLVPLADAPNPDFRKEWYYEYYEYPEAEKVRPHRGIRTERYKYIFYHMEPQEFELYDLQADPGERNNLAGRPEYASLQADLRSRMEALRAQVPERTPA